MIGAVKGKDGGDENMNEEKLPHYTLYGFIWGFKECVLVAFFLLLHVMLNNFI